MKPLPHGWKLVRLGEVADTALGKMLDRGKPKGLPQVPYLRNVNVQWGRIDTADIYTMELAENERDRFAVRGGDLLVCEGGEIGRAAIWRGGNEYLAYQKAVHRVRSKGNLDLPYLRYLLELYSSDGTLSQFSTGSTIAHLPQQRFRELPVPLSPLQEQRRIVDILEDHLSRLDSVGVTLAACRQRSHSLRDAIIEDYLFSRPASRADVRFASVGDVAAIDSGPAFKSRLFGETGEGIRLLRGDNIEPGRLRWNRTKTWPNELLPGYEHLMVAEGDIILAMDRPVVTAGLKIARVETGDLPALLVQRVARIKPKPNVHADYLYSILQSRRFVRQLLGTQVGTQIPHITLRGIREFRFPLHEITEQGATAKNIAMTLDSCVRMDDEIASVQRRTNSLKRALLDAAFSGRLTGRASDMDLVEEMVGV